MASWRPFQYRRGIPSFRVSCFPPKLRISLSARNIFLEDDKRNEGKFVLDTQKKRKIDLWHYWENWMAARSCPVIHAELRFRWLTRLILNKRKIHANPEPRQKKVTLRQDRRDYGIASSVRRWYQTLISTSSEIWFLLKAIIIFIAYLIYCNGVCGRTEQTDQK